VNQNDTVEQRQVKQGVHYQDLVVVSQGVKAGETVVVEGQLALANGMKVNRKEYPSGTPPAKAESALTERESSPKDPGSKQESPAAKSAL
jgi:hypothetical protein